MDLDYTCTYCGKKHPMLTPCPQEEADLEAEAAKADAEAEAQALADMIARLACHTINNDLKEVV